MPPKRKPASGGSAKSAKKSNTASAAPDEASVKKSGAAPTVQEILSDRLTQLANEYWAPGSEAKTKGVFKAEVVDQIFKDELTGDAKFVAHRVVLLEFSCYLENYLWPNFDAASSTHQFMMSMVLMLNVKFKEGVPAWECFEKRPADFAAFVGRVLKMSSDGANVMTTGEKTSYVMFLINCFQSLENAAVRGSFLKLVSLPLWHNLSPGRLALELKTYPNLRRHWDHLLAKGQQAADSQEVEVAFLPNLITDFLQLVEGCDVADTSMILYLERFLELLIDLLSQLPTRRFLNLVIIDMHVVERCSLAALCAKPEGKLFNQLLEMLVFYVRFEINDQTGKPLTSKDMSEKHYSKMSVLQRVCFKHFGETLRDFSLSSIGSISSRSVLAAHLSRLSEEDLGALCDRLRLKSEGSADASKELLREILVTNYETRESQLDSMNMLPLYPNEEVLWDADLVPLGHYSGETVLALPKLNLQFLTFHDYLLRSFNLYRLESAYEIREDMVDAIKRVAGRKEAGGKTVFTGWARMATPIEGCRVTEVKKPEIGEIKPAEVRAEISFNVSQYSGHIKKEWDEFREHDIVFLVTIASPSHDTSSGIAGYQALQQQRGNAKSAGRGEEDCSFPERYGVLSVRGAEVVELVDEAGVALNDAGGRPEMRQAGPAGDNRTLKVLLDPAQYQKDMADGADVYDSVNLIIRRSAKENNFKSVLETIRDLMNTSAVGEAVPAWLHDVFLGYGDPASASFGRVGGEHGTLDFKDTFLNADHARSCFADKEVVFVDEEGKALKDKHPPLPYRCTFEKQDGKEKVLFCPYTLPNPGPYPQDQPRRNGVRFTPVQTQAIRAGLNPGLTMVVGPPGTGKTDVAVQIISNLYANFPEQRTILVTHSNQALNDLFQKLIERDIDEGHMLRLGAGEKDLKTDKDFSKWGRVNYALARRLELLGEVERLAVSIGESKDNGVNCETAEHFDLNHFQSRVEKFELDISKAPKQPAFVGALFPFKDFFATSGTVIFGGEDYDKDLDMAQGCFRHVRKVFEELQSLRAFELLRSQGQRADYLLTKQAKIIAMTCTHAALVRSRLVKLGFKFENIVMEESAQILEIETFIPMLLQNFDSVEGCRLKRVVLIGDHHQLPPVVKNMAFQKYGHLDQSLFARFVRLGTPTIELNQQGRARSAMAALYSWRYKNLGDLPAIGTSEAYIAANAGLAHTFQLINVEDFQGKGEMTPTPHFFQNLGEAEYAVALFQYMRLLGYPANKITILSTYNGQKHLIRDILKQVDSCPVNCFCIRLIYFDFAALCTVPFLWLAGQGDNSGPIPGSAKRLHYLVVGSHAQHRAFERRSPSGRSYVSCKVGPVHIWPQVVVRKLL
jgi:intron-binding protein aquarius